MKKASKTLALWTHTPLNQTKVSLVLFYLPLSSFHIFSHVCVFSTCIYVPYLSLLFFYIFLLSPPCSSELFVFPCGPVLSVCQSLFIYSMFHPSVIRLFMSISCRRRDKPGRALDPAGGMRAAIPVVTTNG